MGKTAVVMQEYLGDAKRFADLFNVVFFQGKQVIEPQQLREQSERYTVHSKERPGERRGGNYKKTYHRGHREEYRDVKKKLENGTMFRVLAIESQSFVDYTMPLRCMEYDVQEYLKQVRELRNHYERTRELRKAEWLSGIKKEDRLMPVYTLCLYHGEEAWDGPVRLADMMDFGNLPEDENIPFADYSMKLYCINEEVNFDRFRTDLREVFLAFSCRSNRAKLEKLLQEEPNYRSLAADTVEVIAVLLNFWELAEHMEKYRRIEESGEERYDMCKALMDLRAEERILGQELGQKIGQEIGEKIGERIGETGKTLQIVRNMIARGYSDEDICAIAECSEELVQEVREDKAEE